jgi:hypothetical protein
VCVSERQSVGIVRKYRYPFSTSLFFMLKIYEKSNFIERVVELKYRFFIFRILVTGKNSNGSP